MLISLKRSHGSLSDVKSLTEWREISMIRPAHKVVHNVLQVNCISLSYAVQKGKSQAVVICPSTSGKVKSAIPYHICDRMP